MKRGNAPSMPSPAFARFFWIMFCAALMLAASPDQSSQAQTYKVLHAFTGGTDGASPGWVLLVRDSAGNLYGTAGGGGAFGYGNLFKLNKSGKETVLYSFSGGSDGRSPDSGVVRDQAGNLYGTTNVGGNPNCKLYDSYETHGCGVVFKVTPAGKFAVLHTFMGPDGGYPDASSLQNVNGTFYATTGGGGVNSNCQDTFDGCGTVFQLTKKSSRWTEKVLYSFGWNKGWQPFSGVIADSAGNLYGTTEGCNNGAQDPCGAVFRLAPGAHGWSYTMLHGFTGGINGGSDGAYLWAGLVRDSAGNLYGATQYGGADNYGTIFQLTPSGKKTLLYSFSGSDGAYPLSTLTLDASGNLYGPTSGGGSSGTGCGGLGCGTIFKLDTTHNLTVLHNFTGGDDGEVPLGALLLDGGKLYGTANGGGAYNSGTVFELTP
jgi:uncharacterized repeat protein (TIGR03803 family)